MNEKAPCSPERTTAFSGAALFSVGLFTGLWTAMALTGKVTLQLPRLALATHLNALLGGLWLLALSYSMQFLSYGEKQRCRLACLVIVPSWANWLVTLIASILGVNGLDYTSDLKNNVIAFLLQTTVVVPALAAGIYWVRGFLYKGARA